MPKKLSYNIKTVKFPTFFCFFPRSYTVEPILNQILMLLKLYIYSSNTWTIHCVLLSLVLGTRTHKQKNIHFLKINMTHDLKMIPGTALKGFPKDWNHFSVQIFTVLTLCLICYGTFGHLSCIIGLGAWHFFSYAKK